MKRSPLPRRGKGLPVTRKAPRRVAHPFPLPSGEPVRAEDVRTDTHDEGPQAELCRGTLCCVCFALSWRKVHGARPIDWSQLPTVDEGGQRSEAHHEPERSNRADATDADTVPLCSAHHTGGFVSRHSSEWKANHGAKFWCYFQVRWQAVRDEMRRRAATTSAMVAEKPGPECDVEALHADVAGVPARAHLATDDVPSSTWLPPETARTR